VTTALNANYSAIAHDKEINSLCVSPNDKILASASQDKTVKVAFEYFIDGKIF